jgi:hypothetical protein
MVRLFFSLNGKRQTWVVPFHEARRINRTLLQQGAAVYWSERC